MKAWRDAPSSVRMSLKAMKAMDDFASDWMNGGIAGRSDYITAFEKVIEAMSNVAPPKDDRSDVRALVVAAKLCERMIKEALPKFNWGASALDANAIALLNSAPGALAEALKPFKEITND